MKREKPAEILFFAPGLKRYEIEEFSSQNLLSFVPISLTGTNCALQCEHCAGKLLESMRAVEDPQRLWDLCSQLAGQGARGILISGGCDPVGMVPFERFVPILKRLKQELPLKVIMHTGLLDDESAAALAEIRIDGVMLDIIGHEETIESVYHLAAGVERYEQSLALLARYGVPAMPHIVLGLHYGKILGEDLALEMVARYPIATLVLVVLTPLHGTGMSQICPPDLDEIERLFHKARVLLPQTPIMLGCARPAGPLREAIDRLAIDAGLNGIAYPAEGTAGYARAKGFTAAFREECCALACDEVSCGDD